MKTTYLVYKQVVDGVQRLAAATQEEWDAIMKGNRGLPIEQRRCFMKDCFEDGAGLDCMYIEVTAAEYREWNSKNTVTQRKRKASSIYLLLSLDNRKNIIENAYNGYIFSEKKNADNTKVYRFRNETGTGEMRCYDLLEGIQLSYNNLNMETSHQKITSKEGIL